MNLPIPAVEKFMTRTPHSVGVDQPLNRAHAMMREHHIRHLPVLHGGRLMGVVSDRDLHIMETIAGVDPRAVEVGEAMSTVVYAVPPGTPLDEVAREMAEHRYGCVVVMEHEKVVGIFTTVDLARALAELLHTRTRN